MRSLIYVYFILHCKFPSPIYANHMFWLVSIACISSSLLSTFNTTLSQLGLWIKSTFIMPMYRATLIAWCSLVFAFQNTSKTHCMCIPWSCATPNNVVTFSSNALQQKNISHKLVISFDNHLAGVFPFAMDRPSCINTPPTTKSFASVCTSKGLSSSKNSSIGGKNNLLLNIP